ncbi:hypothetical protein [Pelagibacterium montanilacus]|uniref:hypothetical protein n=1 Tax=Pelagibacterium montanilacus TaxID=2185280 RepID=UPI000F8F0068|nr:hypothetical protein [Pelagibacterium montanilacus]
MTEPSKREEILEALRVALEGSPVDLARNRPLGDLKSTIVSLNDGETELVEEYFNPSRYEFVLSATLEIVVASSLPEAGEAAEKGARDAALDALIETLVARFEAIETMPDRVTDWRMLPPSFGTQALLGAAGMKGCELEIEIDYWSDRSSG